ncbi:hypothetical protein ES708_09190 [subsurface metagenome]
MANTKWEYKIIYPEYKKCDEGIDIRIRPVKIYDEEKEYSPRYRLNKDKHSWDGISGFMNLLEADLPRMKAEFKRKAKELRREMRRKNGKAS